MRQYGFPSDCRAAHSLITEVHEEYAARFGRSFAPLVERYRMEDAEFALTTLGPIVVICIVDGSHFARERLMAFTPWHPDAVSGSHPPHLLIGVDRK